MNPRRLAVSITGYVPFSKVEPPLNRSVDLRGGHVTQVMISQHLRSDMREEWRACPWRYHRESEACTERQIRVDTA